MLERVPAAPDGDVAEALLGALRRAPGAPLRWVTSDFGAFVEFVMNRLQLDDEPDPVAAVEALRVGELALVFGCLRADPNALREFESVVIAQVDNLVGSQSGLDIKRDLLAQLFVTFGAGEPRAARYSGRGALVAWVRTVARNFLRSSFRRSLSAPRSAPPEALAKLPHAEPDPEARYARSQAMTLFGDAVREAIAELPARDRALLFAHYFRRRSIQQLAKTHGVHRETASIWLAQARQRLARHVGAQLENRRVLGTEEARGVIAEAVELGISSLGRILASPCEGDA